MNKPTKWMVWWSEKKAADGDTKDQQIVGSHAEAVIMCGLKEYEGFKSGYYTYN